MTSVSHVAAAATKNPEPTPATVLNHAMESELHRAMGSLGNTATDATRHPGPLRACRRGGATQALLPQLRRLDSDRIAMAAQFGPSPA